MVIDAIKDDDIILQLLHRIQALADASGKPVKPISRSLTQSELELIANMGKWTKVAVIASGLKYRTVTEWKKFDGVAYDKGPLVVLCGT